jgi:hypothetical protein
MWNCISHHSVYDLIGPFKSYNQAHRRSFFQGADEMSIESPGSKSGILPNIHWGEQEVRGSEAEYEPKHPSPMLLLWEKDQPRPASCQWA